MNDRVSEWICGAIPMRFSHLETLNYCKSSWAIKSFSINANYCTYVHGGWWWREKEGVVVVGGGGGSVTLINASRRQPWTDQLPGGYPSVAVLHK